MESFDRLANPNLGRGDADHCEQRGPQAHERQKKTPRQQGLDRGANWRARAGGQESSAPEQFRVGAVALRGNPRNLLTRWCGRKNPAQAGVSRGGPIRALGGTGKSALDDYTRLARNCSNQKRGRTEQPPSCSQRDAGPVNRGAATEGVGKRGSTADPRYDAPPRLSDAGIDKHLADRARKYA
jgi:hypothetical protein